MIGAGTLQNKENILVKIMVMHGELSQMPEWNYLENLKRLNYNVLNNKSI